VNEELLLPLRERVGMRGDIKCPLTSNPLPLAGARKKYDAINSHVLPFIPSHQGGKTGSLSPKRVGVRGAKMNCHGLLVSL